MNFVIPHFGAGYFREALMLCDLCPNVHLDTSSSNRWTRYQAAALDMKAVFRRTLDVTGPSRLLFGTDSSYFPRGWSRDIFEEQCHALRELGTSENDARLIFGGNLERLLGRAGSGLNCATDEARSSAADPPSGLHQLERRRGVLPLAPREIGEVDRACSCTATDRSLSGEITLQVTAS